LEHEQLAPDLLVAPDSEVVKISKQFKMHVVPLLLEIFVICHLAFRIFVTFGFKK